PQAPVYSYESKGRRDPFQPPPELSPKRPSKGNGLKALEVTDLKLAGIVWEKTDYYALVEAPNGVGYVIRRGAIIGDDAKVVKITKDSVVFEVRGRLPREEARMVTLTLKKEE
ncbi:MAG: pilus assembly protein PilP, partial [candidate division NC10 bacterium]|nr:pilus assembly protein PilP [candidate division NC10 bacterium]